MIIELERCSSVTQRNRFKKAREIFRELKTQDEHFLDKLMDATEEIWNKNGFNVEYYCSLMGKSKSQLYRNLKMFDRPFRYRIY